MRFSEYTGYDALDWETSVGALSDTSYKLPVYRGWPSRPYVVVGDVRHQDPRKQWEEGEIRDAVRAAQAVGGDAIIIRHGSESGVQAITGTANTGGVYSRSETTGLVVRWQTEAEIQARYKRDQRLLERLKASQPQLLMSEQTGSLAVKYLLRTGVKDSAPEFFPSFLALVKRIHRTNDMLSGQWLFKAVVKTGGIVSQTERSFMGIATVRVDGESIAIVSVEGETEANFSGQQNSGRLNGQIGIAGISAKAEGVAITEKISVTYQSVTQSGTAQGTFVLQR